MKATHLTPSISIIGTVTEKRMYPLAFIFLALPATDHQPAAALHGPDRDAGVHCTVSSQAPFLKTFCAMFSFSKEGSSLGFTAFNSFAHLKMLWVSAPTNGVAREEGPAVEPADDGALYFPGDALGMLTCFVHWFSQISKDLSNTAHLLSVHLVFTQGNAINPGVPRQITAGQCFKRHSSEHTVRFWSQNF